MSARSIGSGTVSFGLVSIPVKVYSASESGSQLSFNMVHKDCGTRLKQQYVCPTHNTVVDRAETGRGYEFAKGQYVLLSDDEYKALQEIASNTIELIEFVPAAKVDPIYFEKTYYLGPDKGGERAYRLLGEAMIETGLVGLAKYAARGKQYLVLVRPLGSQGLILHQLHYADEVKAFAEVPIKDAPPASAAELKLAKQIIQQIATTDFKPEKYEDEVKTRMLALIEQKVAGHQITAAPEAAPEGQIIDLMDALRKSLGMAEGAKAATRKAAATRPAGVAKAKAAKKR